VTNTKVYLEIVKQLRDMITADGLMYGDKIPSERELSERLNVGRSSVREALRALELLGLIETRRGEGTFIRDFRGHQLVQLLSTFILQDDKARKDVLETKVMIEKDCLRLAIMRGNNEQLEQAISWVKNEEILNDDEFFERIMDMADNHLLLKMWLILKEYYYTLDSSYAENDREDYLLLLEGITEKDEVKTFSAYGRLRNLSLIDDKS